LLLDIFGGVININTFIGIFTQGFLAGIIGIFSAVSLLIFLKNEELRDIFATLRHKIWRAGITPPDPTV
jgi:hypothetical protein